MKHNLNEVKRMQQLAGLITESQLNELNEPEKELVDAILGEGINEGKFDPKEILAKLMAVAKKGLLTATIISTVLASCNFGPSTEETIQNRLDQYKTIDSMQLVQKEKDEAFKKDIDSLKQDLKAIEYQVGQQPQQESQFSEIRQLVREVLDEMNVNEYETSEIVPGIRVNDEGEYDISPGLGLELYDRYLRGKTTVGELVSALKIKGIPEDQALKIAFDIENKYSGMYNRGSKYRR